MNTIRKIKNNEAIKSITTGFLACIITVIFCFSSFMITNLKAETNTVNKSENIDADYINSEDEVITTAFLENQNEKVIEISTYETTTTELSFYSAGPTYNTNYKPLSDIHIEPEDPIVEPSYEKIKIIKFKHPLTGELETINVTNLMKVYDDAEEVGEWDFHHAYKDIRTLYYWLCDIHGMSNSVAAAITGNTSCEARFGQQQGSYTRFKNLKDVEKKLTSNTSHVGYGCVQWTSKNRRLNLLKYYEEAAKHLEDMMEITIVAECCFLIDELKEYNAITDLYKEQDLEDATGCIGVIYEGYEGCNRQFKKNRDGLYRLQINDCTSADRLMYAQNIYALYNTTTR